MLTPQPRAPRYSIAGGISALPNGLLLLEQSRSIVAADAHFAYEDVIGGALPLWSTAQIVPLLLDALRAEGAEELIFLGDVIHGSVMSEGAASRVAEALDALRSHCTVTLIAGNHEGRTRGQRVLGATVERAERQGWSLVHGDRNVHLEDRAILGHLHPSLNLGGGTTVRTFLFGSRRIVVPALNPYSPGLNVLSPSCNAALRELGEACSAYSVVASDASHVYPFGALDALRGALRSPARPPRFRRTLRPD